ncbi:MAG: hypothetical protein NZ585_00575 [Chloracidobacterium sp.]|nr:hypothetical protein [Chloracidobacterium sp.]MDW8216499.1 hypothetical protein [Acidobacteriota bacterium]
MVNVAWELPVPYIGKNVERKHVEEFFRYHREPDEVVIAVFDGIIFDGDGKRVGGLTLHDYVILTDRHFILWARGLQSDVLDRLDYRGVRLDAKQADTLHGELALEFTPPAVSKPLTARVDLLPIMDLPALDELFSLTKAVVVWDAERSAGQAAASDAALTDGVVPSDVSAKVERIRTIVQESLAKRGVAFKAPATVGRPPAPREPASREPSLESPFGTGRPVSNASYAVYRVAQAAKDAVSSLPTDIGKTLGLDETLSKLVDRIPKVEDISQITALIEALNKLLITVSENPAARAFLLQAIDRMVEQGSPLKQLLAFIQNTGKSAAQPTPTAQASPPAAAPSEAPSAATASNGAAKTVAGPRRTAVKVSFAKEGVAAPVAERRAEPAPQPPLSIEYGRKTPTEATPEESVNAIANAAL